MWLQRLTHYLLHNLWVTVGLVFLISFVPLIGMVGILVAALITLRRGVAEGAIVTLAATLPYFAGFILPGQHDPAPAIFIWVAVGVATLSNVMTWVFAVMLRRHVEWGNILQVATLAGVLVISVVHLLFPDVANWWGHQLTQYYQQTASMINEVIANKAAVKQATAAQLETIKITKQFATGVITAGILLNAIFQLVVARWWEAVIFKPGMLQRELHNIRLSRLAGLLFVASLIVSYIGNTVVLDIMPVIYLLFTAAGLSLIHYMFGLMTSPLRWFWISLMYVVLLLAMPVSLVMVSAIALLDIGFDVRQRFKKI